MGDAVVKKATLRSPVSETRGLGSAKSGVHHFLVERLTGLALIPLGLWFVSSLLLHLADGTINSLVGWLHSPLNTVFFTLFVLFTFIHSSSGMQVIIEDYVHCRVKLIFLLLLNKGLHIIFGLMSLMALFNLHFMPPVAS